MAPGTTVTIGSRKYRLHSVLGAGTYACVWSAKSVANEDEGAQSAVGVNDASIDVAIKEIQCGRGPGILPDATLPRAMFEIQVMQKLASGAVASKAIRAPRILDYQFWAMGADNPEAFLCRVAMTRFPGRPLGEWLADVKERGAAAPYPCFPPDSGDRAGGADELEPYFMSLLEAILSARSMLVQMAPTFSKLNYEVAFHRDVNARNLLVHAGDPAAAADGDMGAEAAVARAAALQFAIVDFGSSMDAIAWIGDGEGSWQSENPTGDARYWGPASWTRHLGGPCELLQDPALFRQYSRRLDMFSLAVCAMEAVASLHEAHRPSVEDSLHGRRGGDVVERVERLMRSWNDYWAFAVQSFEHLTTYSHLACCGDEQAACQCWEEIRKADVPQALREKLATLCIDLCATTEQLRRWSREVSKGADSTSSAWKDAADTLSTLRDMLYIEGSVEWSDLMRSLGVASVLTAAQSPGCSTSVAAGGLSVSVSGAVRASSLGSPSATLAPLPVKLSGVANAVAAGVAAEVKRLMSPDASPTGRLSSPRGSPHGPMLVGRGFASWQVIEQQAEVAAGIGGLRPPPLPMDSGSPPELPRSALGMVEDKALFAAAMGSSLGLASLALTPPSYKLDGPMRAEEPPSCWTSWLSKALSTKE